MKASTSTFITDYAALLAAIDFNRQAAARYLSLFNAEAQSRVIAGLEPLDYSPLMTHYQGMHAYHITQVWQLQDFERLFQAVMEGGISDVWGNTPAGEPIGQPWA